MAHALLKTDPVTTIFFQGGLGAGKTTMIRSLVETLPNGHEAEVSSPSFNLYNTYPTKPETAHYDLYRLEGNHIDESLYEFLDEKTTLLLIEWAEKFPDKEWPTNWLLFQWQSCDEGRLVELTAHGITAQHIYNALAPLITELQFKE